MFQHTLPYFSDPGSEMIAAAILFRVAASIRPAREHGSLSRRSATGRK